MIVKRLEVSNTCFLCEGFTRALTAALQSSRPLLQLHRGVTLSEGVSICHIPAIYHCRSIIDTLKIPEHKQIGYLHHFMPTSVVYVQLLFTM